MKPVLNLVFGIFTFTVTAQHQAEVIYCNEYQNVALVMRAPIAQAVTGSDNYIFSYNQQVADSLGLLQGRPGEDSNLIIRTTDGGLYSYLLRYSDSLQEFIHFVKDEDRVNLSGLELGSSLPGGRERSKAINKKEKHLNYKLAGYFLKRTPGRLARNSKNGLSLEVQGLHYFKDQVYVVIELRNRSKIDFKIDQFSLARVHGTKRHRSSYQKLIIEQVYSENFPEIVARGDQGRFVMVYPKFTLGDHEKLQVLVSEENGNRYLEVFVH